MKRKYSIIEWAMKHYSIVFLLVGLLVVFGIIALQVMPKQEFPGYTIRQGIIVGVYPGATSGEVEKQLAEPLEQFLFSYPEVKRSYTTTSSQNGICYAMVELNDNIKNKDEVWSKIKHGLTTLKMQLPSCVLALVAQDDFGDTSALLVAIESKSRSYKDLKDYADDMNHRLRRIESVSNLRLYGVQNEQITVYADRNKLSSYGISDKLLIAQVFSQSLAPGGSIRNDNDLVPIHFNPTYSSVREVEDQIIFSDPEGNMIRVKDIAKVIREYPEGGSYITCNGNPCLVLSVEMREGYNIVRFGKDVNKVLSEFKETILPDDVTVNLITDQAAVVNGSVISFMRDLLMAIVVIIVVVMMLFPLRSALVAAIVIPLNTFISVGIMYLFGIPLNTVTLAGLIVVLGMTVDNAIVMIDGYIHYLNNGYKPWDAAVDSAHKYFMPMFLATGCICLIFYPILILFKGQFAEFTYFFPFTITINLMISLVMAVMVIPFLEVAFIKPKIKDASNPERETITGKVHDMYVRLLDWNFRHAWLTISIGVLSILASLLLAPYIKFRLMPVAERDQFAVEIYLPDGTPIVRTAEVADSLRILLSKDKRVKSITQFTGTSSPRFHLTYAPKMPSDSYAQFIVNTGSSEETEGLLNEYTDFYAHYFPNAYIKFKQIDFQFFTSFEFRFYGENIEDLKKSSEILMAKMRGIPELTNVCTDWGEMLPVLDVELDPVASSQLGVTRAITAANLPIATQFAYFPSIPLNMVDYLNFGYVMAAQPVFTGGRIYNGNKLAKTGYEINREKKSMTDTEVLVRTEELYWSIRSLNEKLVTIDSYRKLLDNLDNDVSAALKAGLVQRTDLLKVQLKQNELEANRLKLKDGIALSKKALCQHIGIPYDSLLVLTDTIATTGNPAILFVNPDEAVKNRNEYKILEKAVQTEELQKKIVTGEYLPQLAVGVAGVYTDVMDKTNQIGIAFATLSVPISDWWGGTHKIRQSNAKVENANNRLNETSELLALQITQVQNELNQNYFNIGNAEKSAEQAQENLKVTKDNYDAGVTSMSDLLEAQSVYQSALNSISEAKCNYQIARAKYLQAINAYK